MNSQNVRLIDVFALGPLMMWYAVRTSGMPEWARTALFASGALTVVYNGANWLAVERGERASLPEAPEDVL
jgi:hypothetical protein